MPTQESNIRYIVLFADQTSSSIPEVCFQTDSQTQRMRVADSVQLRSAVVPGSMRVAGAAADVHSAPEQCFLEADLECRI